MPLPERMVDRWEHRADIRPGQGQLYWHFLLSSQPQAQALASTGRDRLAGFNGLHFTPLERLHITAFTPGPAIRPTQGDIEKLAERARWLTCGIPPATVSVGRILYHPQAIVLDVRPAGVLDPARDAVRQATESIIGSGGSSNSSQWIPHVTLAYSTACQSAEPIIAALGNELPSCEITINSISLVWQNGPERLWDWHTITEIPLTSSRK
jgi:2'-5' RNA ligase